MAKQPAPDKRVEQTMNKLEKALILLLEEKNLRQIRVTELCASAGIDRSTFYDYFSSISQFLDWLENKYLRIFSKKMKECRIHDDFRDYLVFLTSLICEKQKLFTLFYSSRDDINYLSKTEFLHTGNPMPAFSQTNTAEKQYQKIFCLYGGNGILKEWILSGCTLPPEQISELLLSFFALFD